METLIRKNETAGWYGAVIDLFRELKEASFPVNINGLKALVQTIKKHIVRAQGTANNPGYIAVIQKNGMIRISSTRRPNAQARRLQSFGKDTLLLWYGFTENMLEAKRVAMKHFEDYRVRGDWLDIPADQVIQHLKRI